MSDFLLPFVVGAVVLGLIAVGYFVPQLLVAVIITTIVFLGITFTIDRLRSKNK